MPLTDWVQTAATIYFAWQQNRIFKKQNEIFAIQSGGTVMQSDSSWVVFIKRYWPTLVLVGLIGLTIYDIYDRHSNTPTADRWNEQLQSLESITNKRFINQQVELDGKRIENSTFIGTTLIYRGTRQFILANNTITLPLFIKIVDGPQATGAAFVNLIVEKCRGHEDACDIRGFHEEVVDENLNPIKPQ
jgi:hypothetical protein